MTKADREAPIAVEKRRARAGEIGLFPVERWAEDELAAMPEGVRLNAFLTIAKSDPGDQHGQLLKKYMAGINELYDYLPVTGPGTDFPTATKLRREILKHLGFCEVWPQRDGSERREAHSMSRDAMSFEDLQTCFELTRTYCLELTERLTGTRFDPWKRYEDEHPKKVPE